MLLEHGKKLIQERCPIGRRCSQLALQWLLASLVAAGLNLSRAQGANVDPTTVTTGSLLKEMADLERLAQWPSTSYRTVQFSSYDRRSKSIEAPGWFSNADGFGREPIPGFLEVLRKPEGNKPGLYLVAKVEGPGAIARGWSAGMDGILRVYLDPSGDEEAGALVFEGTGYDFLARRSAHYLKKAGLDVEPRNAFVQEDADYLPMPFARGLRITWEGKLDELHFYHLQVRLYEPGTSVRTFDPAKDLPEFRAQLEAAVVGLTKPEPRQHGEPVKLDATIEPGRVWAWSAPREGPGAVRELKLRVAAEQLEAALRGCLLRIAFDGSQRPQVEAPIGDFFASGPGVNPFSSLPFSVEADGTMTCRFVMPYEKSIRMEVVNHTPFSVNVGGSVGISDWQWNERSLHFRAKWRADHDLLAGAGALDLPYVVAIGKGVFVGCAAMIMNPSGVPTAGGNWWGEGDEKILVDGETEPSTFGTGSEDYFNYSWSRPDLFAHPYCGQPLDSGPDTAGYVSNHRFQVLDAIPFETSLCALMELWAHTRTPGLSYSRVAYHYARPNAIDDHRGLTPSDLRIVPLPRREPQALGGATNAKFYYPEQLRIEALSGKLETVPFPLATRLQLALWHAAKGDKLKLTVPVEKAGRAGIRLVALHRPDGATVRVLSSNTPLKVGNTEQVRLKSAHAPRILNIHLAPVDLEPAAEELTIECVEPGVVGLDYIWVKAE